MWQFEQAIAGHRRGLRARSSLPMTGGNVSFYNSTAGVRRSTPPRCSACSVSWHDVTLGAPPWGSALPSDDICLLGDDGHEEFGGSEWAWHTHRHLGGVPPA